MKLAQARKIGRMARDAKTSNAMHDNLVTDVDADDIATAFQKLDFNAQHNANDGDKILARAIWDFNGN